MSGRGFPGKYNVPPKGRGGDAGKAYRRALQEFQRDSKVLAETEYFFQLTGEETTSAHQSTDLDEAKLFAQHTGSVGIDFDKYDEIPVERSGRGYGDYPVLMSFTDIPNVPASLQRNISLCRYERPTPVQKHAIPIALQRRDVMCCAQTGSGKTAAFLIPMVAGILIRRVPGPQTSSSLSSPSLVPSSGSSAALSPATSPPSVTMLLPRADPSAAGTIASSSAGSPAQSSASLSVGSPALPSSSSSSSVSSPALSTSVLRLDGGGFGRPATPMAVVLAPTRELASQVLRPVEVYGGVDVRPQMRELARGCHLLAATPGRLLDLVDRGVISLAHVKWLCLDEADRMLDMGFEPQIRAIVEDRDMPLSSDGRQTLMFSATFPRDIQRLAGDFMVDYVWIGVGRVGSTTESITQTVIQVDARGMAFNNIPGLTLVNAQNLIETGVCGEEEDCRLVVSLVDSARLISSGLDIPHVAHVINYDLPSNIDDYVHRIGRTGGVHACVTFCAGRTGNQGVATAFFVIGNGVPGIGNNVNIARDLAFLLQEAHQIVPDFLTQIAQQQVSLKSGSAAAGRGGRGAFHGATRDYRQNVGGGQYTHHSGHHSSSATQASVRMSYSQSPSPDLPDDSAADPPGADEVFRGGRGRGRAHSMFASSGGRTHPMRGPQSHHSAGFAQTTNVPLLQQQVARPAPSMLYSSPFPGHVSARASSSLSSNYYPSSSLSYDSISSAPQTFSNADYDLARATGALTLNPPNLAIVNPNVSTSASSSSKPREGDADLSSVNRTTQAPPLLTSSQPYAPSGSSVYVSSDSSSLGQFFSQPHVVLPGGTAFYPVNPSSMPTTFSPSTMGGPAASNLYSASSLRGATHSHSSQPRSAPHIAPLHYQSSPSGYYPPPQPQSSSQHRPNQPGPPAYAQREFAHRSSYPSGAVSYAAQPQMQPQLAQMQQLQSQRGHLQQQQQQQQQQQHQSGYASLRTQSAVFYPAASLRSAPPQGVSMPHSAHSHSSSPLTASHSPSPVTVPVSSSPIDNKAGPSSSQPLQEH